MGLGADQPLDTKFFPGIMEGLLGSHGINATGGKDPPTSSKEGAARMWATTIQNAICRMEKRDIPPEITQGMPSGLHISYEEDFLHCQTTQVPRVFTDPKFLPGMANSVYDLPIPSTRGEIMPSPVIADRFGYPEDPGDGPSGTVTPKTSLPPSPAKAIDESDTDSTDTTTTTDLDWSQTQESSARSEWIQSLRKQHRETSSGSGDGAPLEKRMGVSLEHSHSEGSSPTGIFEEVLQKHRFSTYGKDHEAVHWVRVQILGLGDKPKPSQEEIDSSPIFNLRRVADDSRTPAVIGQ